MTVPRPRPGILGIQPYRGGNAEIDDPTRVINLSANESALGASPRALGAFKVEVSDPHESRAKL